MTVPDFTWCPSPGTQLVRKPRVTTINYGDGYMHRNTVGINPMNVEYPVSFSGPQEYITAIDNFLQANYVRGFWFQTEGGLEKAMCVVDEWSITWSDRSRSQGVVGTLSANFRRVFNEQPLVLP